MCKFKNDNLCNCKGPCAFQDRDDEPHSNNLCYAPEYARTENNCSSCKNWNENLVCEKTGKKMAAYITCALYEEHTKEVAV